MLCQAYNIKMFGKCIKKIDDFIQWTKNWHIFHCLFIINTIGCLLFLILNMPLTLDKLSECFIGYALYFYPLIVFIAIPLAWLITVIKFIKKQHIPAEKTFLLQNPIYNVIYTLNWIYILCLTIGFFSFLFADFSFLNEMEGCIMAIGMIFAFAMIAFTIISIELTIYVITILILTKIRKPLLIKNKD